MNITARDILEGQFGASPKLRLLMAINFNASVAMRRALQAQELKGETQTDINEANRFVDEIAGPESDVKTLAVDRAIDFIVASYVAGRALALTPDADGRDSFKWALELQTVKTPLQWLQADIDYQVKQAVDRNMANVAHIQTTPDKIAQIIKATETRARADARERAAQRAEVVASNTDAGIKNMPEDDLIDLLEESMVDLGINWRDTLAAAAERHQRNLEASLMQGKVARPDTDLLMFLGPKAKAQLLSLVKDTLDNTGGEGLVEKAQAAAA
jgi:hypothetical protein